MSYTTEELLQIRRKMESEIALTETTVENFRELTKPISPENAIGRVSRMDAINNKSVNDSALRNAELKLNNLRVALTKIDEKILVFAGFAIILYLLEESFLCHML